MGNKEKQIEFEKGWEEYQDKKKKDIEELAKAMKQAYYCKDFDQLASVLIKQGYYKTPENSVVLTREELSERDYEFRQIGYDECLRDDPKKDKYIKTLERKIDQLNAKLEKARKETAREILKKGNEYLIQSTDKAVAFACFLGEIEYDYGVE